MNYERAREKRGIRYLRLPTLWEVSIALLLFYAFFFQYSVTSINRAMLALNTLCILLGMLKLITGVYRGKPSFYNWIIAFVLISVLLGVIFGASSSASVDVGIRMIEYCFGYSVQQSEQFKKKVADIFFNCRRRSDCVYRIKRLRFE